MKDNYGFLKYLRSFIVETAVNKKYVAPAHRGVTESLRLTALRILVATR